MSSLFPAFLNLNDRDVLLVGGGKVALAKLAGLREAGARVTVVAPRIDARIAGIAKLERAFEPADLDGRWFAIAAATKEVNAEVARAAEARRVFLNAADDPASASVYLGGVVRKGDVTLAISTGGRAPALAGLLREALQAILPDEVERWLSLADALRQEHRAAAIPFEERRPLLLKALNQLYPRSLS